MTLWQGLFCLLPGDRSVGFGEEKDYFILLQQLRLRNPEVAGAVPRVQ